MIIRDGWGYRAEKDFNATIIGENEFTKQLMLDYPTTLLDAAGEAVGLPKGYQGNSEVGHMTIGAGRIFFQSLPRINKAIESGEFLKNPALYGAVENCKANSSNMHIIGLLQTEGVHAHMDHCLAILDLCKRNGINDVVVHVISDGRDAPVDRTLANLKVLDERMTELGLGKVATISGRYYAMDRDKKWERTKASYDCIVEGKSERSFTDPESFIQSCYANGETDEFIVPSKADWYSGVDPKDSIIFYNFRTDRTRQLTMAIVEDKFEGWQRNPKDTYFVAMTEFYSPMGGNSHIAYPPQPSTNLLGEVLAKNGIKQLRISETEKYAHVTFFFNGQKETPNPGEDRIMIPSPKVATYDLKPEMSVYEVGDRIVEEIHSGKYDIIITNFVNADMVGHTGVWDAILKAVKAVDDNVKKVVTETLNAGGIAMVLADHGCIEDKTESLRTSHTKNSIPFIIAGNDPAIKGLKLKSGCGLQDVAPTMLKILGIPKPDEMTGQSVFD